MSSDEEKMIDALLACEEGLTPWEVDFIDNLDQVYRERPLSEKQADRLKTIYERLC